MELSDQPEDKKSESIEHMRMKLYFQDNLLNDNNITKIESERMIGNRRADDIVQIVLGNANQVFNHQNGTDYYFFAVRDVQDNPVLMMLKVHHPLMIFEPLKRSEAQRSELFDVEHLAYFKGKDPPLCEA
jgi:predicted nucleic acid-binding protein